MNLNMLALAVPLFIGFIVVEYFVSRKKNPEYFNLHNSVANISVGIAERLSDVFIAGIFYFVYDTIQKKFGLFHIRPGIALWILLFLFTDFLWYWYHRLAHEINILWLAHIVHHQSEDFNYTVSARITIFQAFARTAFWSFLPLIGFPAGMITSMLIIHGTYPFFIHTRTIGKLGILEYLFVTPSHHRVHHGSNEKYLDKNYGDVLIIWDKLFGTFQKEEENEPVVYGLTKPLKTYSFLWQHFHFAIELWLAMKIKKTWKEKIAVLFIKPEKIDASLRSEAESIFRVRQVHSDDQMDKPLNRYVKWQMIMLLFSLFTIILFEHYLSPGFKIGFALFTVLTLINCGAIMEQKKWIFYLEFSRLVLTAAGLLLIYPKALLVIVLLIPFAILAYFERPVKRYYLDIIYPSLKKKRE
jgi:sterol desaturase/sphingolipid hydroxylase (fatty acid hydroxylase superfamily)